MPFKCQLPCTATLRFSGDSGLLLATSWDCGVRLYDADPASEISTLRQHFTVREREFEELS